MLLEQKQMQKVSLQIVGLSTELANAVQVKPGDYYKQPVRWMKAYDKVMARKKQT